MLNVGSNYTSFSNYSPDYRARCGQSKARLHGQRRRRDVPLARPGRGSVVAAALSARWAGGAGQGQPRARDAIAAAPPAPGSPAARRVGVLSTVEAGPGEGAERGGKRDRLFPARLCKSKPREVRHRLQTEDGSPRPSSGALRITARPPLSLYLAVLGLLLKGTLLQPVHGMLGRRVEAISAQAAPFLHLGAGVRRSVIHCWKTKERERGS